MRPIDDDARKRHRSKTENGLKRHHALSDLDRQHEQRTATGLVTFAVIPSLLFWAMIIMILEGNITGAIQLVTVSISAGFVGWSLR